MRDSFPNCASPNRFQFFLNPFLCSQGMFRNNFLFLFLLSLMLYFRYQEHTKSSLFSRRVFVHIRSYPGSLSQAMARKGWGSEANYDLFRFNCPSFWNLVCRWIADQVAGSEHRSRAGSEQATLHGKRFDSTRY